MKPPSPDVVVRPATLEEILTLRRDELRPGQPLEAARFDGDLEPATRHLGAFMRGSGENVGCASFMATDFRGVRAVQLRGMATRADLARRGIGTALLALAAGIFPPPTRLWCNARLAAAPFYRRLGWTVVSAVFDIPTIGPHVTMARERSDGWV